MPDFLLEIGTEEIPATMIAAATRELERRMTALLEGERLRPTGAISTLETPRRLAIVAAGVPASQPDLTERLTGPSVAVAYKDGQPTQALHAFSKKNGVELSALERVSTAKGDYVSAQVVRKGRHAREILSEQLAKQIGSLYWPKTMHWRRPGERFVRPVRWLVAMLDEEIIPLEFGGVRAGNHSRGHRLLSPGEVKIPRAGASYIEALRAAKVLGSSEREREIRRRLDEAARTVKGGRWREDRSLLETVVNLTEWPSVVLGNFDRAFLELPEEVLVTVMRDHQKYFALEGANGRLLPHFLAVLNRDGDPQGLIRHGNERVLAARFNDARFFWQTDQKHPLRERVAWLKNVTFHKDLGSYYDKTLRVQRLCSWLSEELRQRGVELRPGVIHKAAYLAKADLTTELVKEFTELQGIVGGLYAAVQVLDRGMPDKTRQLIAQAIYDQYKPHSAEDTVPRTAEGAILAICDKADTLAGMFSLGLVPSGSKDPFALRRQANGIVRTLAEHQMPLPITHLFELAREAYRDSPVESKFTPSAEYAASIDTFLRERFEFYLREQLGFKYDVVNAVMAAGAGDVVDAMARVRALSEVRGSADFDSISVAFKRIKNILRQAQETGKRIAAAIDEARFQDAAERSLATEIPPIAASVEGLRKDKDYVGALREISKIRPAVDAFFDKVMVMVEDDEVRANRLALLAKLLREFSSIADFSEMVTEARPG